MRQSKAVFKGLLAGVVAAASAAADEPRELRLALIDLVGVAAPIRGTMWEEARRLLAPSGVSLRPRSARADETRDGSELGIIFIPERSRARPRVAPPLGAVQSDGTVTTIWIDVAAVAAVAGNRRVLDCCDAETRRLGLALGRVLTHELVHVLAPERDHSRRGLLAAKVTRATLVDASASPIALVIAKRLSSSDDH
jgi:hypothetical protein